MWSKSEATATYASKRIRHLLALLIGLFGTSKAVPISGSPSSSNWLASGAALLVFVVLGLSGVKLLFVRYRRTSNLRGPGPIASGTACIHHRFKLPRYFAPASCRNHKDRKLGFLIGLFGSPSFEIRSKPSDITLVYPGEDTAKSSQKHSFSVDTSTSSKSKTSLYSAGPVILFNEDSPSGRARTTRSEKQKRFPALLAESTKPRLPLPAQLSFDLGRIRRKRHASLSEVPGESLPWPHNHLERATFRLVNLYSEFEAPLPLDRDTNRGVPYSSSMVDLRGLTIAQLNKSQTTHLPQLPSFFFDGTCQEWDLAVASPPQTGVLQKQVDGSSTRAFHGLTKSRPSRQWVRRASLSPNLSVINEHCPSSESESAYKTIINYSLPRHPLYASDKQHLPSEALLASVRSLPVTYNLHDALKRRERMKSSSGRSRGELPLGPSPLRLATLPDNVERTTPKSNQMDIEDLRTPPDEWSTHAHDSHLRSGLGLPSIQLSSASSKELPQIVQLFRHPYDESKDVSDLLRELAEETKDWDESVVLNEGFKSMIQQSRAVFDGGCSEDTKHSTPKTSPLDY